jgi:hypothetical protein
MDAAGNKIKRLKPLFQPFNAQFHFLDAARRGDKRVGPPHPSWEGPSTVNEYQCS